MYLVKQTNRILAAFFVSILFLLAPAFGEPTRYQFGVTLQRVINPIGFLDSSVRPATEATGHFTFDPECAETIIVTADSKFYVLSSLNRLTLHLGDHTHLSNGEVNLQIAKYSGYDAYTFDFNGPYWIPGYREYLNFWGPKDQCFVNTEVTDPGFPGDFACYTVIRDILVVTPNFEVFGQWHSMAAVDPCTYDSDGDSLVDCSDPDDNNNGIPDSCDIAYHSCRPDLDNDGLVDGSTCDTEIGPPRSKEDCKESNWPLWNFPQTFNNQGDCIQFVNTGM